MMTTLTYHIAIDTGDDGTLATDITYAITEAQWRIGCAHARDTCAHVSEARLMLDSARITPDTGTSWLGKRLVISAHHDADIVLFTGWITAIEAPATDQHLGQWALIVHDAIALLASQTARLPPQTHQRTGALIAQLLADVIARPRIMAHRWLLGREGHSRLDSLRFGDAQLPVLLDEGQTVCAYAGATWGTGIALPDALRQIADAERGRVFADRTGRVRFYDRHHLLQNTPSATFSDAMQHARWVWGRDLVASVEVTCQPYTIGAPDTPLWIASEAIRIPAHDEHNFRLPYHDANHQPCATHEVRAPLAGVDYHINRHADGTGDDHTHQITSQWQSRLSAGLWTLTNPLDHDVFVLAGATLIGTPLIIGDAITLRQHNDARRTLYGAGILRLDLPAISDANFARDIAQYESARQQPASHITRITLDARAHPEALAVTLFDTIQLNLSATTTEHHAHIYAETHHLSHGASRHSLTWDLMPANPANFWVIGRGTLDTATALAL